MSEHDMARSSGEYPISRAWLVPEEDFVGTVHSVFATACNLEVGDVFIVVHDAAKSHTSTSVRVATTGGSLWSPATRRGDEVTHRDGVLSFGEHRLPLRRLPLWTPASAGPSPWTVRRQSTVIAAVEEACRANHPAEADPRLVEGVRTLRVVIATAIRTGAGQPTSNTETADGVDRAVKRLIGFGAGLTPAGDDVLVGLLAVLHRRRDQPGTPGALADLRAAIQRHVHRTTDISAHYLKLAVQGHFGESLEALLDGVDSHAPARTLHTRTAEVLSLGATSGADTVRGVLVGLDVVPDHPHHPHLQEDVA